MIVPPVLLPLEGEKANNSADGTYSKVTPAEMHLNLEADTQIFVGPINPVSGTWHSEVLSEIMLALVHLLSASK